jgi:pyruvate formate lyase activating enzyme
LTDLPLITEIKRHSLEDGPGIRSVVFFKGCPLRCVFCHNPECRAPEIEVAYFPEDCINCRYCSDACPRDAIDHELEGGIVRDACDRCMECVAACPGTALRAVGERYSVDSLVEILLRDAAFYRHSGGGVTLSGGECTLHAEYVERLVQALKSNNIHVLIETCGHFEFEVFRDKILPHVDLVYYDLKLADEDAHRRFTGVSNRKILDNFRRLVAMDSDRVIAQIPLIPGITSTRDNLEALLQFIFESGGKEAGLLPYNPMGWDKYRSLGRPAPRLSHGFMDPEEERAIFSMFRRMVKDLTG